jgi:hypothetical protein
MNGRRRLSRWLFWVVLTAVGGLTAPLSAQEVDPAELIQKMGDTIESLDRFVIRGDSYTDARLPEGLIVEQASEITAKVVRPGSMMLATEAADGGQGIHFHDGVFTIITQPQNFYAQTEIPDDLASAVAFAIEDLEIDAPLMDLMLKDVGGNLTKGADIRYLSPSLVRGKLYHHIALRGPEVDLQIWIAAEGPPLPGKIVLTSKWEGGSPRFVAFLEWDTDPVLERSSLEFEPKEDARKIDFARDVWGQ